jgi:uncharacterized protein
VIDDPIGHFRSYRTPKPFHQFILKLHSRCNLNCSYCYLYTMADQRWRQRSQIMPSRVVAQVALRIAEHVRTHRLTEVAVVLHGGEPLLAGPRRLRHVVETVRDAVGEAAAVHFSVQTNGTVLDEELLRLFGELDVRIVVSLDGTAASHDRARVGRRGGSHVQVVRGLDRLTRPEFRHLFSGLLCVIDLQSDPLATYQALLEFRPLSLDLLLPHAHWSRPPSGPPGGYADWLIPIFDHWFHAPTRLVRIRLFEEIINVLLGGTSAVEGIGATDAGMIVVETDGQIEQSDILAATFEGAADLGLNVFHDDFDAAARHPRTLARRQGTAGVPAGCRRCRWAGTCCGGLYPHRYHAGSGFDHPSVYCTDLYRLFAHVHATLTETIAQRATAHTR